MNTAEVERIYKHSYRVGGSVRDDLMERNVKDLDYVVVGITAAEMIKDLDYVVVGITAAEMISAGFTQVGKDFPVFICPQYGDEYALARTERSTGKGYGDFVFNTEGVTLEDDLKRRDLTINAIAVDPFTYEVIDPFGGENDIANKILRHVDDAGFKEDPLRILRLARFCAQFPEFTVDSKTLTLCTEMVIDHMLDHLTEERVANELIKALSASKPSRFFIFLKMVGALAVLFPEVDQLSNVIAGSYKWHPEGDTLTHTMMVLDQATQNTTDPVWRFAALVHDLGKGTTNPAVLPHHYGHEERGVPLVKQMCARLKMPSVYERFGVLIARYHTHVHNFNKLNAKTIVHLFESLGAKHDMSVVLALACVSKSDARGRGSFFVQSHYPNATTIVAVMSALRDISAREICTDEELKRPSIVIDRLLKARIAEVKRIMKGE